MTQLVELQSRVDEFREAGFEVFVVSYDPEPALASFAARHDITYDLLSDVESEVIRRFGILNTVIDPGDQRAWPYYGVPFPGTYVVDESGVVTEKFFNRHYATRTSPTTILDKALGRAVARPESPEATRSARQAEVSAFFAGEDMKLEVANTLHVRLELADGLHVYGEPLPDGFYATTATVRPSTGIRIGEPIYPRTTPQDFPALGVTLNTYEGVVDIAVPVTRTAEWDELAQFRRRAGFPPLRAVTLDVEVNYQACNDTICYRPERVRFSVPVPAADLVFPTLEP